MKKLVLIIILILLVKVSYAQFGVSYHLNNAYIGFNYQINDRFLPEARFSTFNTFDEIDWEVNLSYIFLRKDVVDAYAGAGITYFGDFSNDGQFINFLVVPIGLNIYPFENKSFGFLIEIAPMIGSEPVLRGNVGLRFRFMKKEE